MLDFLMLLCVSVCTASYSPPAVYPKPTYKTYPKTNCTVQDETVHAEVCTPYLVPACSPVVMKGTKVSQRQKCFTITKTVCSATTEAATVTLCTVKYYPKPITAEATLLEVGFEKECVKHKVTVCNPKPQAYPEQGYGYNKPEENPQQGYGYGKESYQHCNEVDQETCYNNPHVTPKSTQVELKAPYPKQDCESVTVHIPSVQCRDVPEKKCIQLPYLESVDVTMEQCTVELGHPRCKPVDLVLPKQICTEIVYPPPPPPTPYEYPPANPQPY